MIVLKVRNVHQALPQALSLLYEIGIKRDSRNGLVLQSPEPVATVYSHPCERVMFWPERDANPFFHLYESLWMLAGRNDLAGPQRYVKSFGEFSDNGLTLHGAYGHRWRRAFSTDVHLGITGKPIDQLEIIAEQLQKNPVDRRCVLQMWDTKLDLGHDGKDLPCNDTATFQIGPDGRLNLVVFCRSNDIVWGCYGANAVHFSMLLEYMALWIGIPVGTYTQISVNWHGYLKTLEKVKVLSEGDKTTLGSKDPYCNSLVSMFPMCGYIDVLDEIIKDILFRADSGFKPPSKISSSILTDNPWALMVGRVLFAHQLYKETNDPSRAKTFLENNNDKSDWTKAAIEWLGRRIK